MGSDPAVTQLETASYGCSWCLPSAYFLWQALQLVSIAVYALRAAE